MKLLPDNPQNLNLPATLKLNKNATGYYVSKGERKIRTVTIKAGTIFNVDKLSDITSPFLFSDAFKDGFMLKSDLLAYKTPEKDVFVYFDYIELKLTANVVPFDIKGASAEKTQTLLGFPRKNVLIAAGIGLILLGLYYRNKKK
jgi:hypothetical protein